MEKFLAEWISEDIAAIRVLLEEGAPFFEKRIEESRSGYEAWKTLGQFDKNEPSCIASRMVENEILNEGAEVYCKAYKLILESVLHNLSDLIDKMLLLFARKGVTSNTRYQNINMVKEEFNLNVTALPQWNYIKLLEEYTNAVKHRGGFYPVHKPRDLEPTEPGFIKIPITYNVELSVELLRGFIDIVHQWLLTISSVVGPKWWVEDDENKRLAEDDEDE